MLVFCGFNDARVAGCVSVCVMFYVLECVVSFRFVVSVSVLVCVRVYVYICGFIISVFV